MFCEKCKWWNYFPPNINNNIIGINLQNGGKPGRCYCPEFEVEDETKSPVRNRMYSFYR